MQKLVFNGVNVFGRKSELMNFQDDVAANGSAFSLKEIITGTKDDSNLDKSQRLSFDEQEGEPWGTIWDALHVELSHEREYLNYKFITIWSAPFPIYDKLVETYKKLNFYIISREKEHDWGFRLGARHGKYDLFSYEYAEFVPCKNNQKKKVIYRKDLLNNTLKVVQKVITYESETGVLRTSTYIQ